jgi:hypothetical protein
MVFSSLKKKGNSSPRLRVTPFEVNVAMRRAARNFLELFRSSDAVFDALVLLLLLIFLFVGLHAGTPSGRIDRAIRPGAAMTMPAADSMDDDPNPLPAAGALSAQPGGPNPVSFSETPAIVPVDMARPARSREVVVLAPKQGPPPRSLLV